MRQFWLSSLVARILAIVAPEKLLQLEVERCHEIIDMHLHLAPWFDTPQPLIEELESSYIQRGLLYNPYPRMPLPYDLNTLIHQIALESNGRIFALASLNTTHDDWNANRDNEMQRLRDFLDLSDNVVLGAKLAPPHTCLPLQGPQMDDVLTVVNQSTQRVLAMHIGTTPFCGPMGAQLGVKLCCDREYVDPTILIPKVQEYSNVTFVLLHSGHEFLPPDTPDYYYNFTLVDHAIEMARIYPNVYLSVSAMFAVHNSNNNNNKGKRQQLKLKYPGGFQNLRKMRRNNVTHKVMWGSDASFYQGQIKLNLIRSLQAMVRAGLTAKERCHLWSQTSRHVFHIPPPPPTTIHKHQHLSQPKGSSAMEM